METIISLATRQIYDITATKHGENNMPCPECSTNRRKKNTKCFSYNAEKEVGYCSHCEARFVKHVPFENKQYLKPEYVWENFTKLSDKAVKWFEGRGISQRTLLSKQIGQKMEWMPQTEKEESCIVFPYFKDGILVNTKFRDGKKNFKLFSGAELIWWNYDALKNFEEIIIVEGEIDALSFIQAGFENVVSVPNGASTGKMEYFDSSFDDLNKIKTFILATDNDLKGIELKNDFLRRLGIEKCKTVNLKQFKDVNELLMSDGAESVQNLIKTAKDVKLSDIYTVSDFQNEIDAYFENGLPQGLEIGLPELAKTVSWQTGRFGVVTGAPSSGKSEWVDFVYSKLNTIYGWKLGYYSPESMPLPLHFSRVFQKFVGKRYEKGQINEAEKETGEERINDNVFWVAPDDDFSVDEILARFEYLVKAKGCKAFVIDPFNRIEQGQNHSDNERLFIKKTLVKMISFAKKTDSLLLLIAHPTKLQKDKTTGHFPMPTMYDISGSADFWNMVDYGIAVRREQDDGKYLSYGQVSIAKTKINYTMGETGIWNFRYNINNGRYSEDYLDERTIIFDNSNWITKEEFKPVIEKPLPTIDPDQAFEDMFDY